MPLSFYIRETTKRETFRRSGKDVQPAPAQAGLTYVKPVKRTMTVTSTEVLPDLSFRRFENSRNVEVPLFR
jgi:hypothetical protein